ncbi:MULTISPECIES: cytochrome P450 [unclassified Streptomyces]|uniref:cytochrome P450 family protein n=1 Tax=unclassified Streptomyces TaxID=2593676 RepID=UPI0023666FDB|nr:MULTISPECIES: cytochrome P450 [unclassified Streptomyces]MDF3140974.1 cytochrome P450 [Streptomyces sp. T21Q-yed]WDF43632.1 cytochrome P450 [Streptomyces sp. T12]
MSERQILVLDPTGSDPDAEHQVLRDRGPATVVDILGVRAWSVSDPALLKQLLTSKDVSKDGRAHWPAFAETVPTWPLALWVAVENMFTAYGDNHSRLRRMVAPALSARRTAALQADIEALVNSILDDLAALPADEVADLREQLAYPLPIAVIGELMGVPADRRTEFRTVVDNVFATHLSAEEQSANTAALYGLLDALIEIKRTEPDEDMTSLLIAARDDEGDGSALSDTELRDTLLLMISAGYETTVNVIDQAITTLLSEPEQLAHVRDGRCTWEGVVEETLRHQPAVKHLPLRYARSDIALPDGQTIKTGEAILASYAAANRHPDWHEDADRFDATRPSKEHLAFGHGVHFCLGAPLARLEVATALRLLFERFPDAQLATDRAALKRLPSLISNGHTAVPVRLRPTSNR